LGASRPNHIAYKIRQSDGRDSFEGIPRYS
jgi:hypothetical protein